MILGDKLRERRKYMKIAAEELAEQIGVSRSTYYKYEKGVLAPSKERIETLADALRVPADYLTEETKEDDNVMVAFHVIGFPSGEEAGFIGLPSTWTTNSRDYMGFRLEDDRLSPYCPKHGVVVVRYVREGEQAENGDFVAARIEGRLEIGRWWSVGGNVCISPVNLDYPLVWDTADRVDTIGFVIEMRRYF